MFTLEYFESLDKEQKEKIINEDYLLFNDVARSMLSDFRYTHSLGVADFSKELASKVGYPEGKAYVAGILHDITKEIPSEETYAILNKYEPARINEDYKILHSYTAYYYLKERVSLDEDILKAIYHHTLATDDNTLSMIIYIADKYEVNRKWYDPKIMDMAAKDLNGTFKFTISEVLKRLHD